MGKQRKNVVFWFGLFLFVCLSLFFHALLLLLVLTFWSIWHVWYLRNLRQWCGLSHLLAGSDIESLHMIKFVHSRWSKTHMLTALQTNSGHFNHLLEQTPLHKSQSLTNGSCLNPLSRTNCWTWKNCTLLSV